MYNFYGQFSSRIVSRKFIVFSWKQLLGLTVASMKRKILCNVPTSNAVDITGLVDINAVGNIKTQVKNNHSFTESMLKF